MILVPTEDGSVFDGASGRVIYVSINRFIEKVVRGTGCFWCLADEGSVPFNQEHVIPDWVLRRYGAQGASMTLPNGGHIRYGSYTIPCCKPCNDWLKDYFENPISELLSLDPDATVTAACTDEHYLRMFRWLNFVFFKSHLKDKQYRFFQDRRGPSGTVGDFHPWGDLHHIYCVARSGFAGVTIDPKVYSTLLWFRADPRVVQAGQRYHSADHTHAQTIMFQFQDLYMVAVLNDCGAAAELMEPFLMRAHEPLNPLQAVEVFARAAIANLNLADRPKFGTHFSWNGSGIRILAEIPARMRLNTIDPKVYGEILARFCEPVLPPHFAENSELMKNIRAGKWTFF